MSRNYNHHRHHRRSHRRGVRLLSRSSRYRDYSETAASRIDDVNLFVRLSVRLFVCRLNAKITRFSQKLSNLQTRFSQKLSTVIYSYGVY